MLLVVITLDELTTMLDNNNHSDCSDDCKNVKRSLKIFGKLNIQLVPLNGITDNGLNWFMGLNLSHLTNPKLPFHTYCMFYSFAY